MKIGIDIDDTTVVTVKPMLKYADIFDREVLGRNGNNGNFGFVFNRHYLKELYGWATKTKYDFFNMYYKNVLEECEPMENAPEVIRKFKSEGNEIFFITARITEIPNCDAEGITRKTLEDNNIPYDKLIVNAKNKLQVCKENGIELLIEDSYETCQELEDNGIRACLVTTRMNEKIDSKRVKRVSNWDEIYEFVHRDLRKGEVCGKETTYIDEER